MYSLGINIPILERVDLEKASYVVMSVDEAFEMLVNPEQTVFKNLNSMGIELPSSSPDVMKPTITWMMGKDYFEKVNKQIVMVAFFNKEVEAKKTGVGFLNFIRTAVDVLWCCNNGFCPEMYWMYCNDSKKDTLRIARSLRLKNHGFDTGAHGNYGVDLGDGYSRSDD